MYVKYVSIFAIVLVLLSGIPLISGGAINYASARYATNTQSQGNANDCDTGTNCAINSPQTQGNGTANSPINLQISKFNEEQQGEQVPPQGTTIGNITQIGVRLRDNAEGNAAGWDPTGMFATFDIVLPIEIGAIGAPGVSFEFTWMGPLNVDGFGGVQSAFGSCTPTQYRQDTSLAMPPTVHIDCRGGAPLAEVPAGSTLTYIITLVATNTVT
jgi:hypothetical protein